jgi:CheY-like chemotaxis protein
MPEMTGLEFAQKLQEKPEIKIVLMTSFELTDELVASLPVVRYGEIIRKPFQLVGICNAVRKQLATP